MTDSVERLYKAIVAARDLDPVTSRTAKLLRGSQAKMAKKLAEEAIEVVIDAMKGDSAAVVRESADLIYNLAVVWAACGVKPGDIWAEMDRREQLLGIAEKLPKPPKGRKRREAASAPSPSPAPPTTAAAIPTRRPLAVSEVRHAPKRR
jgi:phosphoribosyl-ATP pyrophosphohydrolase